MQERPGLFKSRSLPECVVQFLLGRRIRLVGMALSIGGDTVSFEGERCHLKANAVIWGNSRFRPRAGYGQGGLMNLGIPELVIILTIVILIFGASRLPEIGRGIGKGIRNFKDATKDGSISKEEGVEKS
jgi:sec-independent protein translocase protein TatA